MAVAALPMYDSPELHSATDALWAGIARALRREGIDDIPPRLDREQSVDGRPDLLLSQVCGYRLVGRGRERLTCIATPCYTAPGCDGALYRSFIVVPATSPARTLEDLRGYRCAINNYRSQSGCNALRTTFARLAQSGRFFSTVTVSGSHVLSLTLLANGQVDVAAIDCITYALLLRCRPHLLADTRIVGQTASVPVGPYVTRSTASTDLAARIRHGLVQAMGDSDLAAARSDLLLGGIKILPIDDYEPIARLEEEAVRLGYRDFDASI